MSPHIMPQTTAKTASSLPYSPQVSPFHTIHHHGNAKWASQQRPRAFKCHDFYTHYNIFETRFALNVMVFAFGGLQSFSVVEKPVFKYSCIGIVCVLRFVTLKSKGSIWLQESANFGVL